MTTHYSTPGIPFSELREKSDSEIFTLLQEGATLHFLESRGLPSRCSIRYEEGEWVYTFGHLKEVTQRFPSLLQLVFRINGLGVALMTRDGEDMDVTLTKKEE